MPRHAGPSPATSISAARTQRTHGRCQGSPPGLPTGRHGCSRNRNADTSKANAPTSSSCPGLCTSWHRPVHTSTPPRSSDPDIAGPTDEIPVCLGHLEQHHPAPSKRGREGGQRVQRSEGAMGQRVHKNECAQLLPCCNCAPLHLLLNPRCSCCKQKGAAPQSEES